MSLFAIGTVVAGEFAGGTMSTKGKRVCIEKKGLFFKASMDINSGTVAQYNIISDPGGLNQNKTVEIVFRDGRKSVVNMTVSMFHEFLESLY